MSFELAISKLKDYVPSESRVIRATRVIDGREFEAELFISSKAPTGRNSTVKVYIWVAGEIASTNQTAPMSQIEAVVRYRELVRKYGLQEEVGKEEMGILSGR